MNTLSAHPIVVPEDDLGHSRSRTALRRMKLLAAGYLSISALTLAAIVVFRNHVAVVNTAVWIRGSIVAASATLTFALTVRAARGSRPAYRRLRIISAVMVAAIAVIISLPGTFPLWMKVEQGACGLLLIGFVILANGKHLRSLFAGR